MYYSIIYYIVIGTGTNTLLSPAHGYISQVFGRSTHKNFKKCMPHLTLHVIVKYLMKILNFYTYFFSKLLGKKSVFYFLVLIFPCTFIEKIEECDLAFSAKIYYRIISTHNTNRSNLLVFGKKVFHKKIKNKHHLQTKKSFRI